MGAWSPAAVHRPALAWWADARRASVRPLTGVPHCRASRAGRAPGGQSLSITDELLENHAALHAGLQPRWLPRPPAKQAAVLACSMPPQRRGDPGAEGGRRPRQQGRWRGREQRRDPRVAGRPVDCPGPRRDRARSPHPRQHAFLGARTRRRRRSDGRGAHATVRA